MLDWLNRMGIAASSSRLGGFLYDKVCRRIDSVLIPLTGARLALGPPGQTLLLTTTGAKSGKRRTASLAYLRDGDDLIVIASKGGAPVHPGWYHNLKHDPHARVQHRGGIEERVAREATGDERDRLFARMGEAFENFLAYQERATERRIPVIVLSKL
jgi:deazaflavin-dependent oxidoreductase (nitroreductase family)